MTWFTGSYDAELDTLYWQTGNPGPDYNGEERLGDNLYSDCVLALDPKTGKLKWHYQFTPHDLHDWDAAEPVIVVDSEWQGQPRKLLFTANRNGFFYVFDRTDGRLLLTKTFVKKMNWAEKIGADGRPVLKTLEKVGNGTKVCPSQDGATNWYSSSYLPATGLFYLQTVEKCDIYSVGPAEWQRGQDYLGGAQRPVPGEVPQKVLRAIDPKTGNIAWELPQTGRADTWGGTLVTQTGVLFFGEDSGRFQALDAEAASACGALTRTSSGNRRRWPIDLTGTIILRLLRVKRSLRLDCRIEVQLSNELVDFNGKTKHLRRTQRSCRGE